jgi:hypothetical protein
MKKKLRSILGLAADSVAILLILPGAWNFISPFWDGLWGKISVSALMFLLAVVAFRLYRSKYQEFTSKFRQIQIKEDVRDIESIKPGKSLKDTLPSRSVVSRWTKELDYKARQWSEDAISDGPNLYISLTPGDGIRMSLQNYYYSAWKELQLCLYAGHLDGEELAEPILSITQEVPPFYTFRNWQAAVLKAHSKIEEYLPATYEIVLRSRYEEVGIAFKYKQGKVNRELAFIYKDGQLIDEKTKKSERIQ